MAGTGWTRRPRADASSGVWSMNNGRRQHRLPEFDRLDDRLLLAGGISASLSRSVLTITGTGAADTITVRFRAGDTISVDGVDSYRASQVRSIVILAGRGNDSINLPRTGNWRLPVQIRGGPGDDRILVGSGADRIDGEAGNDRIWGGVGSDRIDGGSGNDRILGEAGN